MSKATFGGFHLPSLLCLALQLAACGEGSTSGGPNPAPTSSPTPAPTPAPSPTPTPSPTSGITVVQPTPLSTSTRFGGTMVSGGFVSLPTQAGAYATYDAAANVYTLKGIPASRFGMSGKTPDTNLPSGSPDPTETRYVSHDEGVKLYVDRLDYVTHTGRSGHTYVYAAVGLHSYISNYTGVNGSVYKEGGLITFGFPTGSGQVPTSGKRAYVLDGFDAGSNIYSLSNNGWTITLTADFASGTYVLLGTRSVTTEDAFWTFVDTATISSSGPFNRGGNAITGMIHIDAKRVTTPKPGNSQGSGSQSWTLDGPLSAVLFGPSAEEIGVVFTASGKHINGMLVFEDSTEGGFLGRFSTD